MNTGPFLIMLAAALWAVDALIRTPLTQVIPAASIVFLEHLIGFLVLSPVFVPRLRNIREKLSPRDWLNILLLTLLSSIGGTLLFTEALKQSFSSGDFVTPLLLQKTQPLLVILLSVIFLKEQLSWKYVVLAPIALIGSYLMSFGLMPPTLQLAGKELVFLLALGAAAAWGTGTILSKKMLQKLSFSESTAIRFAMAIPVGLLVAGLLGQFVNPLAISSASLLRFVLIAITTGAAALLLYYKGLAKTEAKVSTISELTFPFVSILIAITPLNPYGAAQVLSPANIIGIVLLVVSVLVISLEYAKKSNKIVVSGEIVRGSGDGKKLGLPTANIKLNNSLNLRYGVYACKILISNKKHNAILHFGPRMVFGEEKPQFEVHIFNFKKNIYGKTVDVEVLDFIRGTQNFKSLKKMTEQIREDIKVAKKVLAEK